MSKRTKPQALVVTSGAEAEKVLAEMAALDRSLDAITAEANAAVDAARDRAAKASEPLLTRRQALETALVNYGTFNRDELFQDRKSIKYLHGQIGYRQTTKLEIKEGFTEENVLLCLRGLGFEECIRTKREINRESLGSWEAESLDAIGMRRVVKDEFFIKVLAEAPATEAAAAV